MSNYTVNFCIEGKDFGSGNLHDWHPRGESRAEKPLSKAYFCETCGRVWATAAVEGQHFVIWSIRCEKHEAFGPNAYQLPGSLWLDWEPDYTNSFPLPVIMREFKLHLEHYDRFSRVVEPVPGF